MVFESACLDLMDLCIAGLSYLWEQAKYDPVKRQLTCHISLKNPQTSQVQLSLHSIIPRMMSPVAGMPLCGTMMFISFLLKLHVNACMTSSY